MSVGFISGKPGAGKTLYAFRLILYELRHTRRRIVTNVSIKFGDLAAYLDRNGWQVGEEHLRDRITILEEEQLKTFFTVRGPAGTPGPDHVSIEGWKKGERPDYSVLKDAGVLFVLDEVHIAFNARAWQETGQEVMYYLSQHRKLGDDVLLITQSVLNVDRQMRSVAQDFTYIRNFSKEKAGIFRLPALFMRRTFLEPAGPTSRATETGTFTLDVSGIASCYDTAAGVGIHGRAGADIGTKKRGIHWAVYPVVVVAIVLGMVHYAPVFAEWATTGGRHKLASAGPVGSGVVLPVGVGVEVKKITSKETSILPVRAERPSVACTGIAYIPGGGFRALLTDGRILGSNGEVFVITPGYVEYEGERFLRVTASVPAGGRSASFARGAF